VIIGLATYIILAIHPMWVIEEYAIIERIWDWFIPIIPPIIAFIIDAINMNCLVELFNVNAKIIKGAIFCQEARIKHDIHEILVITDGNQKWNGAIPSFSIKAEISNIIIKVEFINENHIDILLISIILEPNAWAIKYLIAASVSWFCFELMIIGINLNILISIAIHRNNQFVLEITIIDLIIIKVIVKNINGLLYWNIKTW